MDPKEVRIKLGLAEDATDAQVQEALLQRAGITAEAPAGDPPAPTPAPTPEPTPNPAPAPAPDNPTPSHQPTPAADQPGATILQFPGNLPEGLVVVEQKQWEELNGAVSHASAFVQQHEVQERERRVDAAISDGRISPSSRDHWIGFLRNDPNGEQVLASLAPGLVPIEERGHAHSPDAAATLQVEQEAVAGWTQVLFPEVRAKRDAEAAMASGQLSRPRVQSDANYRR